MLNETFSVIFKQRDIVKWEKYFWVTLTSDTLSIQSSSTDNVNFYHLWVPFSLRQQQQEKLKPVKRELRKESLKTLQSRELYPRGLWDLQREQADYSSQQDNAKKENFPSFIGKKIL